MSLPVHVYLAVEGRMWTKECRHYLWRLFLLDASRPILRLLVRELGCAGTHVVMRLPRAEPWSRSP